MNKTDKHYVSEIDKRLAEFDHKNPKSPSQQVEIDKYDRINHLRDHKAPMQTEKEDDIWSDF